MPKNRLLPHTKKPEQQQTENENENVSKMRTSRYGRSAKSAKSLLKLEVDNFQVRKALNVYMRQELEELGRKTYFQRVYLLAQNISEAKLEEYCRDSHLTDSDLKQLDFREYFQQHFDEIFAICERKKITMDHLSGLFIVMGSTHTYLMIEGAEDMLANFFEELTFVHDRLWTNSRVFLVEDKIGEVRFIKNTNIIKAIEHKNLLLLNITDLL